ncbi:putative T7SS-secreted protein [Streptomyces sp. NPDC094472]|uniref:putative T7SS-secreted protein n=1 Tax=Streptomyces sp. NPDC094472 TaxID=3155080 RepID=UPI003321A67C
MTQRDATEGGATERIPPNAKPSEVIYGSPSDIEDLAVKLRAYAGAFKDGQDKLDVLSLMDWTGAGAEGFQDAIRKLPRELESAQTYFKAAANALDDYAEKLRSVHNRVKPIIEDADDARAASKRYWNKVTDYNAAVDRKDDPLPERPPEDDPGLAALEGCYSRLDTLESELQLVIDAAKRKLDKAAKEAPDKPPTPKGWDKFKQTLGDYAGGTADTLGSWYDDFDDLVHDGPDGLGLRLASTADGVAYAAEHPKEFAKAVTNWDEWQRNPARAAGQLTPDLLLALATGGTGAARRGANAAKNATQRLLNRERALRRDGSARDRTDTDPGRNDTPNRERRKTGEPIDVATGEMVMSATDVTLPGALPLVLKRHYVSGHPCGGWFGHTWAGTLDQRLEIDDAGVVYITDDGMLLTYPVPEPDVSTLPSSGPRWPLCWDGKPDGTFTITIPEHNRTLHFAPLPTGGRELALTAISDWTGGGDRIDVTYDPQGVPTGIVHSGGYHIAVDTDPKLLRITALRLLHGEDHEHSTTLISFGYNTAGDLTEVINSTGKALRYQYDDEHRVTSWTDRNGTSYAYVYDHRGRVLRGIGPDGILSGRMHYDAQARTTRYTDSQGDTTTYVCNQAYRVIAEIDPLGNTTRTEWDVDNRYPLAITDPSGHTARYRYDDHDRLIAVERPDGSVTEAAYDDRALPLEIREPNGARWRHTYDDRGARTSTTDPSGATTRFTYNASGHLSTITSPLGHTTRVTTNAAGLPMAITDPLGNTTRVRRGPHGHVTAIIDPLGNTTRQGWTIEGKPAWREGPDGAREKWQWDTEGNLARHTDQSGHTTTYTHTHFDKLATRTDPDGAHYAFTYDTELRLTEVTNAQGRKWHYTYDSAGRLTEETDFNGATRTYEPDAAGRLTAWTNALGETLRYTLDPAGRVVAQCDESTGEVTTYAYDVNGSLSRAANADTELVVERDPLGHIISETVNGRTSTYGYDSVGNQTHRTTPSGLTSTWTYDAAGLPSTLTTAGHTLTLTHDAAGHETQHTTGDVTLTQGWDETGRLAVQTITTSPKEHLLQHRAYTYRPDGYVTQIRELTTGTRRFSLDAVGRVTGVQAHGWTEKYAYDTAGNQTHATAPDHPAAGERVCDGSLIRRAGRTRYRHDAAGRLVEKTRKLLNGQTHTWTYTWNTEDRLTKATTPDGQEWTYTYDPLGRRTSKSSQGETTVTFTWDTSRLAEQTTADGLTHTWDYSPGTHRPLTQTNQELGSTRFHTVITDPIGTPTELITPDGHLAWQHRTTLWGTPLPTPPDATACPLRFPGQYADPETGLNYNYHRYYDPETAHYLTPDPLGLAPAPNPQAYVRNPHTRQDPLGLEGCDEDVYSIEDHVIPRHTRGGAEADATKSLFDDGVDLGELATRSAGQIGHYQAATGNIRYFITDRDIVGADRHGLPTKTYTIVRDGIDGELITMHPGLPRDLDP